jgi:outer membrane protein assembly factor BamB
MEKILFILIFAFTSIIPGKTLKTRCFFHNNSPEVQNQLNLPVFSDTTENLSGTKKEGIATDSLSSQPDSSKFINYGVNLLWQQSLNTPLEALPLIWENKIYIATKDGYINCFDKDGKQLWQPTFQGQ